MKNVGDSKKAIGRGIYGICGYAWKNGKRISFFVAKREKDVGIACGK